MQSKGFLAIVGIIILGAIGAIIYANRPDNNPGGANEMSAAELTSEDHVRGPENSSVVFIEYGDFQCPYCADFNPVMESLFLEYGDRVKFSFRHFPLTRQHPNAMVAHRAAEAAGLQGKFFEMANLLYEQQDTWAKTENPTPILELFAAQLGLDLEKYKADFADPAVLEKINAQAQSGEELDVTGTPTFILNGEKIQTPGSFEEFRRLLEDALNRADSSNT